MTASFRALALASAACLIATGVAAAQESTTIGGYGEVHYVNPSGVRTPATVDLRRFVIYLAHTFSDRLSLRSEVEIEDAKVEASAPAGEVALEQVVLDYRLADHLTLRSGLLLVPVGIINETHEPPTYNGVDRPGFDHDVLPTTWREIGVGVLGSLPLGEGWNYKLYLLNGLVAAGFTDAEGIREGRQEGQLATFANPSLTGRLEWVYPGLRVGASFWYGGATAGDTLLGTGNFDTPVTLVSADARFERGSFALRAVAANVSIGDAAAINSTFGTAVGSRIAGAYGEAAVNLLFWLAPTSTQRLNAFVRHERYDTQAAVPAGTVRDRAFARRLTTFGLTYKPTWNTAFKGDYQVVRNAAGTSASDVLSLGIGYQF